MKRRNHQEWRELFEQQSQSDLSIAQFCQQQGISQSYFYKRKSELATSVSTTGAFIKAQTPNVIRQPTLTIHYGVVTISLSSDIAPLKLAELVKALA
jgi:putative transposase